MTATSSTRRSFTGRSTQAKQADADNNKKSASSLQEESNRFKKHMRTFGLALLTTKEIRNQLVSTALTSKTQETAADQEATTEKRTGLGAR